MLSRDEPGPADDCPRILHSNDKVMIVVLALQERPRRLARPRTPPFHGDNTGSNPVGDANIPKNLAEIPKIAGYPGTSLRTQLHRPLCVLRPHHIDDLSTTKNDRCSHRGDTWKIGQVCFRTGTGDRDLQKRVAAEMVLPYDFIFCLERRETMVTIRCAFFDG
jgi:hypothetical protein